MVCVLEYDAIAFWLFPDFIGLFFRCGCFLFGDLHQCSFFGPSGRLLYIAP